MPYMDMYQNSQPSSETAHSTLAHASRPECPVLPLHECDELVTGARQALTNVYTSPNDLIMASNEGAYPMIWLCPAECASEYQKHSHASDGYE